MNNANLKNQTNSSAHDQQPRDNTSRHVANGAVIDLGLDIPSSELDLDLSSIIGPSSPVPETEKVQKRASNVLKLSQEHERLKDELRAMTARLEAAERKQQEMAKAKNGTAN